MIPRRVLQIWYQGEPSGPAARRIDAAREACARSGFEHLLLCHEDVRRALTAEGRQDDLLVVYDGYGTLHERVDFAKACLLLLWGGVYLDADAEIVRPLDAGAIDFDGHEDVLYVSAAHPLVSLLHRPWVSAFVNNGFYAAPRGCAALRGYVQHLTDVSRLRTAPCAPGDAPCVQLSTGPWTLSMYLQATGYRGARVLHWQAVEPCLCSHCALDPATTLVAHRHELSWMPRPVRAVLCSMGSVAALLTAVPAVAWLAAGLVAALLVASRVARSPGWSKPLSP